MKINTRSSARSGFALIIVLSVVVLLAALIIAFLSQVSTERTAASGYHASSSVRALADNVTSLIEAQINIATTQGTTVSWASQPGMLRTFDNTGNLKQAFKLYSSPLMIVGSDTQGLGTGSTALSALNNELTTDDVPTAAWSANSALWTDLNAPVKSSNGIYNYPIMDNGTGTGESISIMPAGLGVSNAPGATAIQPVPMPVHWLYVLNDGTLVAPTAGVAPNSVNVAGETAANPIKGRIAFWTDDETCKVNVNTASEGTFWDTPHAFSNDDVNLANCQPAQNEFQRFPGHPAMTSLSAIFNTGSPTAESAFYTLGSPVLTPDQTYGIIPRINVGGSNEGTTLTGTVAGQATATAIVPDVDRLYDSLDELIFSNTRASNAGLTRAQLEQAKFFITTHSRAPEINLFNLPRVACWPVYALNGTAYDTTHTTAFDRLIADCATVNGQPYYFQRKTYNSPTADINITRNTQLYSYLQYLTSQPVPGYGGNFLAKYGADCTQILTEIFDYIRCANLYDANIPVVTNMFTPIPATAGHGFVAPTQYKPPGAANTTMGFGRTYTLSEFGIGFICNADGNDSTLGSNNATVTGTQTVVNKVLGGIPLAANEKYIQAIIVLEFFSPMLGWTSIQPDMQVEISGLEQLSITDSLNHVINLGFPVDSGNNVVVGYNSNPYLINGGRGWGGNPTWRYGVTSMAAPSFGMTATPDATSANIHSYLFLSAPVKINASTGQMHFSGSNGDLVVKIYAGANSTTRSASNLLQTLNIKLPAPSGTIPIPNLVNVGPTDNVTAAQNWWSFPRVQGWVTNTNTTAVGVTAGIYEGRLAYANQGPYSGSHAGVGSGSFFNKNFDVVRTVVPAHGDYRLIAANANVPDTVFIKHPNYDSSTAFIASYLTNSSDPTADQTFDSTKGMYFPLRMSWVTGFDIPSTAIGTDTPEATGDFDNCLPTGTDGPFINKPDEGNTYRLSNAAANIPYYTNTSSQSDPPSTYFTPNRIMPSPGMFGSLSSGVMANVPWRTLLFRPQSGHFGASSPEDELLLDLFWMPIVQPYAISDRFSTAGKINMNYQIVPFGTYLTRNTGLQALFKSEKVTAVSNGTNGNTGYANQFKNISAVITATDYRYPIDAKTTLTQFSNKFTNSGASNFWDIFKSEAEICDQHIVPLTTPPTTISGAGSMADTSATGFWALHEGTGDNMRERIYTTLYPRLTTKSNSYTVHFRVQSLQKVPKSTEGVWTDGQDVVTAEYRGSSTIERYIDPNSTSIPDYAADIANNGGTLPAADLTQTLGTFYKWRIISNHEFAP